MKRLACIGVSLALVIAMSAADGASATVRHGTHSKAKKCKHGKVFRKGRCRHLNIPPPLGGSRPPNSIVRASLTTDGPAYVWMQVTGQQGRAGFFPGEGVLNEIPNAHYSGGAGGPGPETDTFTDDLFYGGISYIWYPSPGNRGFSLTICENGTAGPDPVRVHYTFVEANGLLDQWDWTLNPASYGHSCLGY